MARVLLFLALGLVYASIDNVWLPSGYTSNWDTNKDSYDTALATLPFDPLPQGASQVKFRYYINAASSANPPTGKLTWRMDTAPAQSDTLFNTAGTSGFSPMWNVSAGNYFVGVFADCGSTKCVKTMELELAPFLYDSVGTLIPNELVDQRRTAKYQISTTGSDPIAANFWFVVTSADLSGGLLKLFFTVDIWTNTDSKIRFAINEKRYGWPQNGTSTNTQWTFPSINTTVEGDLQNFDPDIPFVIQTPGTYYAQVYLIETVKDKIDPPVYTGISVKLGYNKPPTQAAGTTKPLFVLVAALIALLAFH